MCGIFGILYTDGISVPDETRLIETSRILGHRGPDSIGHHKEPGIGLVHTRLSLIDLSSRSDQPFWDAEKRYCLVYNGEIYNFGALRAELEDLGAVFTTTSDTEVLLHGLIRHGPDAFVPRCEGMFAFAFWDRMERKLVLARDRFGIKPLSVYEDDRMLVFASEIKALAPWVSLVPDSQVTSAYLAGFGGPTRDRSFFRNVSIQAPGTIRESVSGQRSSERSFFHVTDFWTQSDRQRLAAIGPKAAVDHFEELLLTSVKKHLVADAPVGALCSGGLDSSLLMAMACRFHKNLAIFHADVKGPFSEYEAAKSLADHLHLDMKTVEVRDADFIEHMPDVIWHYEYPFAYHPNSIPFLLVSRLVRANGVKAILSGEGSDECFLGYSQIAFEDLRQSYRRLLSGLRNLVHRVPTIGKAVWPIQSGSVHLVQQIEQNFELALDRARIHDRIRAVGIDVHPREFRSVAWIGYHLRTLLHRNDALGMAASIEARFPYLDHDVVRAAVNLPYRYKIRPSVTTFERAHPMLRDKWVVRMVADRYVPRALSRRKKLGFPVSAYARMQVRPEMFKGGFVADLYRLNEAAMRELTSEADRAFIVRLLLLEVWGRIFFQGGSPDGLVAELYRHTTIGTTRH